MKIDVEMMKNQETHFIYETPSLKKYGNMEFLVQGGAGSGSDTNLSTDGDRSVEGPSQGIDGGIVGGRDPSGNPFENIDGGFPVDDSTR